MRLRENGHLLEGDVWVVPRDGGEIIDRIEELTLRLRELDWQLKDIVVSAVGAIEGAPDGLRTETRRRRGEEMAGGRRRGIRRRLGDLLRRR